MAGAVDAAHSRAGGRFGILSGGASAGCLQILDIVASASWAGEAHFYVTSVMGSSGLCISNTLP